MAERAESDSNFARLGIYAFIVVFVLSLTIGVTVYLLSSPTKETVVGDDGPIAKKTDSNEADATIAKKADSNEVNGAIAEETKSNELAILQDRSRWNSASKAEQDTVIELVGVKLGSAFEHVETKVYSCNSISHRIATFKHVKSGALLNLIPGGTYQMGSPYHEADRKSYEGPIHRATIKPMLVGRSELSQRVWDKIGGEDGRTWEGKYLPIDGVPWDDCKAWLKKAGDGLRLPSESEWEYACRSGTSTRFFWGDDMDDSFCWYDENSEKTHKVTEHESKSNAFGLVDMSGNVWEWCEDGWIGSYYEGPNSHLPRNTESPHYRALRGGGWTEDAVKCRSAYRAKFMSDFVSDNFGLRLSRSID